jgi:hypothetical protein
MFILIQREFIHLSSLGTSIIIKQVAPQYSLTTRSDKSTRCQTEQVKNVCAAARVIVPL